MGVYKQGILGPFSGKVGQVVGSNWRGVYYMRSLAPHVNNPKTVAQEGVRGRFKCCVETLRPWKEIVNVGFPGINGQKGWSGAVKANYPHVTENAGAYTLEFTDMQFTNSDISVDIRVNTATAASVSLSWTHNDYPNMFTDGFVLFAFQPKTTGSVHFHVFDWAADAATITSTTLNDDYNYVAFVYTNTEVSAGILGVYNKQ